MLANPSPIPKIGLPFGAAGVYLSTIPICEFCICYVSESARSYLVTAPALRYHDCVFELKSKFNLAFWAQWKKSVLSAPGSTHRLSQTISVKTRLANALYSRLVMRRQFVRLPPLALCLIIFFKKKTSGVLRGGEVKTKEGVVEKQWGKIWKYKKRCARPMKEQWNLNKTNGYVYNTCIQAKTN